MFNLLSIGAGLPVAQTISQLPSLISATGSLVVEAPPGTGKTTLVPPALHNHTGGKVLVTAPRRVAVRAAARRLAQLDGSQLGQRVGYTIRGEHKPGALVEFVTPGVLLRRLLSDPSLEGIAAVAVDEVHERQLDTDLVLGMLIELQQLREDLNLVAMSATLDATRYSDLFGGAQILSTPAVTYPLEHEYAPHEGRLRGTREFWDHLGKEAVKAVEKRGESALVFVPGVREVERVVAATGGMALHGRLDAKEQDAALAPSEKPRIVVATSIAESSLTVPGVRIVVDSGLSRAPRRDAGRNMTGLVTISEAKSTADQRAGRAGREGPGLVIRAFSESEYKHLTPHITPEIATSDLTDAALALASWGTPRGVGLPLLDAPPAAAITAAEASLFEIGAVDGTGHSTQLGEKLSRMPVDPRLAKALLSFGKRAADTVAVLADSPRGDVAKQRPDQRQRSRLARLVDDKGRADPGAVIAAAFPSQVAKRQNTGDYLLASGTRARLPQDLHMGEPEWLAVAEVSRTGSGATIRAAAHLDEAAALNAVGEEEAIVAKVVAGKIRGRKVRRARAIELSSTPVQVPKAQATEALKEGVRIEGLGLFRFSEKAQGLKDRLDFLHQQLGGRWPDVDSLDPEWLTPELNKIAGGTPIAKVDMYPALQRVLPWPEAAELGALAPQQLAVPSGSHPRISYSEGRPVTRVKLQECFGLAASPEIAGMRVQFHLLSPAGRPLAVTDDLASFWAGPYQDVRKEMRGRYPKHPWPEDPWSARATARTKKRS